MVVDDNRDAANTLEMFLSIVGHEVVVEYTAQAAIERAHTHPSKVWLVDIGLPDMDGLELARRLRTIPATASSILIAVTGYSQEQDKKNSYEAGFDYHLVKPIDTQQLLALLSQISASS
jgi:CheY-like chemotaxis protein